MTVFQLPTGKISSPDRIDDGDAYIIYPDGIVNDNGIGAYVEWDSCGMVNSPGNISDGIDATLIIWDGTFVRDWSTTNSCGRSPGIGYVDGAYRVGSDGDCVNSGSDGIMHDSYGHLSVAK